MIMTWRNGRRLKNPNSFSPGRHTQRRVFQFVLGKSSGFQRLPISITATAYPFSASRQAETLPPNPDRATLLA